MRIVSVAPEGPCISWFIDFAQGMALQLPNVTLQEAYRSAVQAHPFAWLLEGEEAGELWALAITAGLEEKRRLN